MSFGLMINDGEWKPGLPHWRCDFSPDSSESRALWSEIRSGPDSQTGQHIIIWKVQKLLEIDPRRVCQRVRQDIVLRCGALSLS